MTGFIPDEKIQEILEKSAFEQIFSEYVSLKPKGTNLVGLCPFHSEKTPSFFVNSDTGLYHCFGCGAGGNLINFIMNIDNLSFPEAVEQLAKKAGVALEINDSGGINKIYNDIVEVNFLAQKYFQHLLWKSESSSSAVSYLAKRGIKKETSLTFGLGYALDKWNALYEFMDKRKFSSDVLIEAGLINFNKEKNSYYDRFRDRIIFPIYDHRDRVVGFGGRTMTNDSYGPKYLNSPETKIFHKSKVLYGFNLAKREMRRKDLAILVEGYMDVIAAHQVGIKNTVASLGISFSSEQAELIKRCTRNVVIAYDADEAGREAAVRQMSVLSKSGCDVKVLDLPEDTDPDDYIKKYGAEQFLDLIYNHADSLLKYKIKLALKKDDIETPEGKTNVIKAVLEDLSEIESMVEKEYYVTYLAKKTGVAEQSIMTDLASYSAKKNRKNMYEKKNNVSNKDNIVSSEPQNSQKNAEKICLKYLTENPSEIEWFEKNIGKEALYYEKSRELLKFISSYKNKYGEIVPAKLAMDLPEPLSSYFIEIMSSGFEFDINEAKIILKKSWFKYQTESIKREIVAAEENKQEETIDSLLKKLIRIQQEWKEYKTLK